MRRERISERMRLLQELVPGCNKVTGVFSLISNFLFESIYINSNYFGNFDFQDNWKSNDA